MEAGDAKFWVEIIAAISMPIGIILVVLERMKRGRSMGVRSIQFVAMSVLIPLILILALEGLLEKSAIGALLGALVGYLFSGIGKYDETKTIRRSGNPNP